MAAGNNWGKVTDLFVVFIIASILALVDLNTTIINSQYLKHKKTINRSLPTDASRYKNYKKQGKIQQAAAMKARLR